MLYRVSEIVVLDLEYIRDRIAEDKPDAAERWVQKLMEAFQTIALNPRIGHSRSELTSLPILFWAVGAYLILYRIHSGHVEIIAVTQGSRDIPRLVAQRLTRE